MARDELEMNATAGALLGLLHDRPMSGWDLARTAEQQLGNFWNVTQSQVYRELNRLAADGLVVAGNRGARDRQPYRLTDPGRDAFRRWLSSGPSRESIRYPLLLTVFFGGHLSGAELATLLDEQRSVHLARLASYRAMRTELRESPSAGPWPQATLAFGIRHEEATLAWFDDLAELLDDQ